MPGMRCAVAVCINTYLKTKADGSNIKFHRFPKDKKIRKRWVDACRRKLNPSTSHICSEHFYPEDYERDLQAELLALPIARKLKPGSIPRINLGYPNKNMDKSDREKRREKREQKELVKKLLEESELEKPETTSITTPVIFLKPIADLSNPQIPDTPTRNQEMFNIECDPLIIKDEPEFIQVDPDPLALLPEYNANVELRKFKTAFLEERKKNNYLRKRIEILEDQDRKNKLDIQRFQKQVAYLKKKHCGGKEEGFPKVKTVLVTLNESQLQTLKQNTENSLQI